MFDLAIVEGDFEDADISKNHLESLLIWTLFNWSHAWGITNSNTLMDFIESLKFSFVIILDYEVLLILSVK